MFEFIQDLKKAYELKKEILLMIQDVHDFESARQYLDAWIQKAEEFKAVLIDYIEYQNTKRIKSKLKGLSPVQYRIQSQIFT